MHEVGYMGMWDVTATNTDLAAAGYSETTDLTILTDLHDGDVIKVLPIYDDSQLSGITTISQLKAYVDSNTNTVEATVVNASGGLPYVGNGNAISPNLPSTDDKFAYVFNGYNGMDSISGINNTDDESIQADRVIVFIE